MFKRIFVLIALAAFFFTSCKKKGGTADDEGTNPPEQKELSDADSLKYLMYQVMEKTIIDDGRDKTTNYPLYYWYDKVPALNPLSSEYKDAPALLTRIKSFAKNNEGKDMDRYSFLDDGTVVGEIGGVAGSIGFEATYVRLSASRILPVVLFCDKNSPAGQAGVKRGWIISTINNQSAQYDGPNGDNLKKVVNALYYDAQATFGFEKQDGTTAKVTLAKAEYNLNPVLFDTVFTIAGKNVGYFVFNSFADVVNQNGAATLTRNEIDRVFNNFQGKNISSLIVDLRYNGGGEVRTMEYLANKIVPASLNGKPMYKRVYNSKLQSLLEGEGMKTSFNFSNPGGLNLDKVFFISTGSTASASELLYNNLRPYMDVKLVGDTTYGKPVGSLVWPITIFKNKKEELLSYLIAITFETKNSSNQGGYYFGLVPDALAFDYVDVPWGNSNDDNLKKIFGYLSTGVFARVSSLEAVKPAPSRKISVEEIPSPRFNGMVSRDDSKLFTH